MLDGDFDLFGSERSEIDGVEHQRRFRCLCNPCPV